MSWLKAIVKVAIAALILNATFRLGSAYATYYQFKDAVTETAARSRGQSLDDLHDNIVKIADDRGVPVDDQSFSVRRVNDHTFVDGSYTVSVALLPGLAYPWSFSWQVEAFAGEPPSKLDKLMDPTRPQ